MSCGAGCWKYAEMSPCNLPQKAASAFTKAMEDHVGVDFIPVLYVGEQLVKGTNYCIICKSKTVTKDPEVGCKVVIVYEDLEGNCTVNDIYDVIK